MVTVRSKKRRTTTIRTIEAIAVVPADLGVALKIKPRFALYIDGHTNLLVILSGRSKSKSSLIRQNRWPYAESYRE